jgi:septal ring factor EnvC (AmiA/AmiB activator)
MNVVERHLSFDEIRGAARDLAENRRRARRDYQKHAEEASDGEREYRKRLAIALAQYRSEGKGAGESEILAQGDVADWRHRRDLAQAMARADLLRIEELEADRAMLRQLAEFSKELETMG